MGYVYLDESGDLGFDFTKKKTSKHFVITCLYTNNKKIVEKTIKKAFRDLPARIKRVHCGTFHCHKESGATKIKVLNRLAELNIVIFSIILYKENVYPRLHVCKTRLYNYIVSILLDRIYKRKLLPKEFVITLIASRRETNKMLNDNFRQYLEAKINRKQKPQIQIKIVPPNCEKGLQAVDFACWSIYRAKEHGDAAYREIIKYRIAGEGNLFPNKKTNPMRY